ncbi:hypothetical protein H257_02481 [Aphanomyces astaci]|uniref:Uncharacterized protein n=1 Tax=Aphanomyces astaci TaxID=112090 RepID=W4H3Y3_APHAT|nr:hypothetical protein H257_02481 [Aphanomyces astaci]ETV85979.1 hypothetical protein H257_02481 [Aphanomyces astaci]|eukprot:XP_009824451.1 hypothetical protein H257_02481 [Aphanomyces astaci]
MSFSHLSQARDTNTSIKEVDVHHPRTLGPGSYGKLNVWEGKPETTTRPRTSFGTSVEDEHPRYSHIERDSSILQDSTLLDEHRLLLKRNERAIHSSPKKSQTKQQVEHTNFHTDKMEPYMMKLPQPLGDKLRQKRLDGTTKHDI